METIDVLKKPFKDIWKLLLSTILGITSAVLSLWIAFDIWGIFLGGYGLANAKKPKELPEFNAEQFLLGLKSFVVMLLYLLLPLLVFQYGPDLMGDIGFWVGIVVVMAVVPIAIRASLELNKKGKLADSLDFPKMLKDSYSKKFLLPWLQATLWGLVVFTVTGAIVYYLPSTNLVIGSASSYVFTVVFWTYLGSKYKV